MQHLYRHFDSDGALLYVGVSISATARLAQHKDASHWFSSIKSITIHHYETRNDVLAAERAAILSEKPLHNLKIPTSDEVRNAAKHAADSRADLVRRITQFNPMYKPSDVATVLQLSNNKVKELIDSGKIGTVCLGEKTDRFGTRKVLRITGWQLIEFIENLEASSEIEHEVQNAE